MIDNNDEAMDEILFAPIVEAITTRTGLSAYVESTGGNVRTIYVGEPNVDGYYPMCIGPGVWQSGIGDVGYLGDLYWGPDDGGDSIGDEECATENDTQETVTTRILAWIDRYVVANEDVSA